MHVKEGFVRQFIDTFIDTDTYSLREKIPIKYIGIYFKRVLIHEHSTLSPN